MIGKAELEPSAPSDEAEKHRRERERYWARKLGRLRLGVESLDEQLAKYRRVTWALTAIPGGIAILFLGLFSVFGRPGIGLILVGILLAPVVAIAWLDYARLARNVRLYQAERSGSHGVSR